MVSGLRSIELTEMAEDAAVFNSLPQQLMAFHANRLIHNVILLQIAHERNHKLNKHPHFG
jgi:hypothetical protein